MKVLHTIAFILVVVGALNWGLVGVGVGDVVALLGDVVARIVYVLVGLSALFLVFTHRDSCKDCSTSSGSQSSM